MDVAISSLTKLGSLTCQDVFDFTLIAKLPHLTRLDCVIPTKAGIKELQTLTSLKSLVHLGMCFDEFNCPPDYVEVALLLTGLKNLKVFCRRSSWPLHTENNDRFDFHFKLTEDLEYETHSYINQAEQCCEYCRYPFDECECR